MLLHTHTHVRCSPRIQNTQYTWGLAITIPHVSTLSHKLRELTRPAYVTTIRDAGHVLTKHQLLSSVSCIVVLTHMTCIAVLLYMNTPMTDCLTEHTHTRICIYVCVCVCVYIKLSRYRPEQAHGRSGRLRSRIFLTFGTRRWWGRQPYAPAGFTPRSFRGSHF
jgi:hypothetical protein